ncbi:MAG: late competence development ComFB family protein [Kamptonema sp. SIO4C4]|nr:late competence development ComFB family protein [Kamptonema sp. SIO4C4]
MTLLLVQDDIDHILAEQPKKIQKQFSQRNLCPDLIAYVLSRIPNLYSVFAEAKVPEIKSHLLHESAERQLEREKLIRQGIYLVLEKSFHQNSVPENSQKQAATHQYSSPVDTVAKKDKKSQKKSRNNITQKSNVSQSNVSQSISPF